MTVIDEAKAYLESRPAWRCREAQTVIRNLIAEREATCTWTDDPEGYWHTDCGEAFEIHAGGPDENGLRYCCFCGRKLAEGAA